MTTHPTRPALVLILALLSSAVTAVRADAHALGAQCTIHGSKVDLESYYDDDSPARNASVRVEDDHKNLVAEGYTDAQGSWSFDRPVPGGYLVTVDAGAGHRTQVKLTITGASPQASANTDAREDDCCSETNNAAGAARTISEGVSRAEFTGYPWLKLGIGLLVIGGLAIAFIISRKID